MDDDEKNECFRKYKDPADSYKDHSEFLTQRGRYSFLFDYDITDYKSWANGLKKAGYATNPKYPQLLIGLIERYELYEYDRGGKPKRKKEKEPVTEEAAASFAALVAGLQPVDASVDGRDVFENNGVPFIVVRPGDSYSGIAEEFNIYSWQLYKYNDVDKKYVPKADEIVYLEKKKKKADKAHQTHTVAYGESIHFISQLYGIRLEKLKKLNGLEDKKNVPVGTKLKLR
jgi:LysM repeat protein